MNFDGIGLVGREPCSEDGILVQTAEVCGIELPFEDVVFGLRVEIVYAGRSVMPILEGVGEASKEHGGL